MDEPKTPEAPATPASEEPPTDALAKRRNDALAERPVPVERIAHYQSWDGYKGGRGALDRLTRWEYVYAMFGLVLGLATIIGGIYLAVRGAAGTINWIVTGNGFSSRLENATPGALLFVVGVAYVRSTRPQLIFKGIDLRNASKSKAKSKRPRKKK